MRKLKRQFISMWPSDTIWWDDETQKWKTIWFWDYEKKDWILIDMDDDANKPTDLMFSSLEFVSTGRKCTSARAFRRFLKKAPNGVKFDLIHLSCNYEIHGIGTKGVNQ